MLSITDLEAGDEAVVIELPKDPGTKRTLLVHGMHVGGKLRLVQLYPAQELALIIQNGRKIALRSTDCKDIKVVLADE